MPLSDQCCSQGGAFGTQSAPGRPVFGPPRRRGREKVQGLLIGKESGKFQRQLGMTPQPSPNHDPPSRQVSLKGPFRTDSLASPALHAGQGVDTHARQIEMQSPFAAGGQTVATQGTACPLTPGAHRPDKADISDGRARTPIGTPSHADAQSVVGLGRAAAGWLTDPGPGCGLDRSGHPVRNPRGIDKGLRTPATANPPADVDFSRGILHRSPNQCFP